MNELYRRLKEIIMFQLRSGIRFTASRWDNFVT